MYLTLNKFYLSEMTTPFQVCHHSDCHNNFLFLFSGFRTCDGSVMSNVIHGSFFFISRAVLYNLQINNFNPYLVALFYMRAIDN